MTNTYNEALETFNTARKEFEEKKKIFFEEAQKSFGAILVQEMTKFPLVEGYKWTQYTPYFNDGEPCEFSVNADGYIVNEEVDDCYYQPSNTTYDIVNGKIESIPRVNLGEKETQEIACLEYMNNLISEQDEDMLLNLYGDHAEIIVTQTDVTVEEYSHD